MSAVSLTDSLRHVIAHQESLLHALRMSASHGPDTMSVVVLGQHPVLGFFTEAAKIVLGAVLALGTSWWIETRRRDEDDKRARRPLKIRVEVESHTILLALKRLVDSLTGPALGGLGEHPHTVLAELKPLLENFDSVQERLYLLRNPSIETGLGVWYRRLRITVEQAANTNLNESLGISLVEGQPPPPPNQERSNYRTRFIELQGEGNRLLDRIRKLD